ncbi:MAG: sugar transporter ATP-binding protein [Paenibacillaceae bacterium]|jgi:multiple sugar transport system permease protein|nr:sugar transporter ATP-binding protein [Paenibacillaceae bacterium]
MMIPTEVTAIPMFVWMTKLGLANTHFPLAGPALSTLAIFTFLHSWDNYFDPLIFISTDRLFTLPVGLKLFTDAAGTQWNLLMAASVMATLPLMLVFFFAQKKFIEGVAMTGLK